jgi:hypothetical protein
MTDLIDKLIVEVTTLKGPSAVVVFIIMFGYVLKMVPNFPNRYIPLVSFILGPLLTPMMVTWPQPGSMPEGVRWPEVTAWATVIVMGELLACLAWISHAQVLRKFIDNKIPALNPGRTVDLKVDSKSMSTEDTQQLVKTEIEITKETKPAP